MRRINPSRFTVATRGTSREINRSIVLNLVRARQPISRADLARVMDVRRGAVTLIVNDLLREGLIFEGATGETVRGRKPTFLYIDSRRRAVVAADIRASETFVMLADLLGTPMTGRSAFRPSAIRRSRSSCWRRASRRCWPIIRKSTRAKGSAWSSPAWSNTRPCACCTRPTLGWRNVDLREGLAAATGLPVQIENSGRACALAQGLGDAGGSRRPRR
jgi:hypothetical protein